MNIPFEMIIIVVVAVAILVAIIAVVLKKRNQEVDDDYQWSTENREKRAKQRKARERKKKRAYRDDFDNFETDSDDCESIIYNSASLTGTLEEDITKVKSVIVESEAKQNAILEAEEAIQRAKEADTTARLYIKKAEKLKHKMEEFSEKQTSNPNSSIVDDIERIKIETVFAEAKALTEEADKARQEAREAIKAVRALGVVDPIYGDPENVSCGSGIRDSHGTSKFAIIIGIFAFIALCALNLSIWISAGPSEETVALCAKPFLFESEIVLPFAFFEAAIFAFIAIDVFEVFIGVPTEEEIKKEKITKSGTLLNAIIFLLVGTAIFSYATFKYEVITEDGYESHSLLRSVRCYQWEDMASFTYDDDERFWNDIVARVEFEGSSKEFKLESRKFKILTEAACEKYNDDTETMFDYIFLEKYAYINEQ